MTIEAITKKLQYCVRGGKIGFSFLVWKDDYEKLNRLAEENGYEDLCEWFKAICLDYPISSPTVWVGIDGCQVNLDFEWSFD